MSILAEYRQSQPAPTRRKPRKLSAATLVRHPHTFHSFSTPAQLHRFKFYFLAPNIPVATCSDKTRCAHCLRNRHKTKNPKVHAVTAMRVWRIIIVAGGSSCGAIADPHLCVDKLPDLILSCNGNLQ